MNWLLKFIGINDLIEALLKRFNLLYLLRALRALLEAHSDKRLDNRRFHEIALAAVARAETLVPSGGGFSKYKAVFAAMLAATGEWLLEEVGDVAKAFESRIDDEIQLAHREMEKILREHGSAKLGEISALLDAVPAASAALAILGEGGS